MERVKLLDRMRARRRTKVAIAVPFVEVEHANAVATVTLTRGKVNAINEQVIAEIRNALRVLGDDSSIAAIVLTGRGAFFSFGFDVPELFSYPKERFRSFVKDFDALLLELFLCRKPVVAAINGHRISLNEITFASAVFAGPVEMLRSIVGAQRASELFFYGRMYSAEDAKELGLIDDVCSDDVTEQGRRIAAGLGRMSSPAFGTMKHLLRTPIAAEIGKRQAESIDRFVDVWYSEPTRKALQGIRIYS